VTPLMIDFVYLSLFLYLIYKLVETSRVFPQIVWVLYGVLLFQWFLTGMDLSLPVAIAGACSVTFVSWSSDKEDKIGSLLGKGLFLLTALIWGLPYFMASLSLSR